jgi:hypothetical protein
MCAIRFKTAGGMLNELGVMQTGDNNFPRHGIGQGDIRPHMERQPPVGPLGRTGAPGVDYKKLRPAMNSLQRVMEEDGMRFPRVRSPQEDHVAFFNLAIRTCAAARSEYRRQTDDAGGVSSPVTAINIVRAHHGTDELLSYIVQFVRSLGATEHAEIARVFLLDGSPQALRDAIQRFIPGSGTMPAILSDKRLSDTAFSND